MAVVTSTGPRTTAEFRAGVGALPILVTALTITAVFTMQVRGFVAAHIEVSTAATLCCAVFVQAVPFLGLGVVVSGLIAAWVPAERLMRWLPRRPGLAVVAAGVSAAAVPGCECGSVPLARRLFGDGALGAAALTFMLPHQR